MCRSWNSVVSSNFPQSRTMIDSFHAIRRIQKKLYDNEYVPLRKRYLSTTEKKELRIKGKNGKRIKENAQKAREISSHIFRSRFLWRKGKERISRERKKGKPSERERLDRLFEIDEHFRETYDLKERFREIYASKNYQEAKERLGVFRSICVGKYAYLVRTIDQNRIEVLNFFSKDGKRDVKHWPEQINEHMREFERKRGAFRTLESWKMLIDMLLEKISK